MTIRRALFLGGALLVLTACSDTTAPSASAKRGGSMANTKLKPAPTTTFTTMSTSTGCRTGYIVPGGRDSTATPSDSTCSDQ
jgi:hypothetical protein